MLRRAIASVRAAPAVLFAEHEKDSRAVVERMDRPVVPQASELAPRLAAAPEDVGLQLELGARSGSNSSLSPMVDFAPGRHSPEKIGALALRKAMILS